MREIEGDFECRKSLGDRLLDGSDGRFGGCGVGRLAEQDECADDSADGADALLELGRIEAVARLDRGERHVEEVVFDPADGGKARAELLLALEGGGRLALVDRFEAGFLSQIAVGGSRRRQTDDAAERQAFGELGSGAVDLLGLVDDDERRLEAVEQVAHVVGRGRIVGDDGRGERLVALEDGDALAGALPGAEQGELLRRDLVGLGEDDGAQRKVEIVAAEAALVGRALDEAAKWAATRDAVDTLVEVIAATAPAGRLSRS